MPDIVDQGVEDVKDEVVTDDNPAEPESTNAGAKKLPWVQDLMRAKAELDQLKKSQEEAEARAEREKAESEGRYNDALEMEKKAREELETKYRADVKQLKLETEFTRAGLVDPRAVQLFEAGFDAETMNASEFVAGIKADVQNAMYFADPSRRQPQTPPASNGGTPDDFDPDRDLNSWLKSSDPKKRDRAIAHNRAQYEKQLRK